MTIKCILTKRKYTTICTNESKWEDMNAIIKCACLCVGYKRVRMCVSVSSVVSGPGKWTRPSGDTRVYAYNILDQEEEKEKEGNNICLFMDLNSVA